MLMSGLPPGVCSYREPATRAKTRQGDASINNERTKGGTNELRASFGSVRDSTDGRTVANVDRGGGGAQFSGAPRRQNLFESYARQNFSSAPRVAGAVSRGKVGSFDSLGERWDRLNFLEKGGIV